MHHTTIRPATLDDVPVIAEHSAQLGYPVSVAQTSARLGAILDAGDQAALVACTAEGEPVGWVHVFLSRRVESETFAELGGLVVDERHRGGEIGRQLIDAAEQWAHEQGVKQLRIRSRSERTETHAIFEHLGFKRTKQQHVFDKGLD